MEPLRPDFEGEEARAIAIRGLSSKLLETAKHAAARVLPVGRVLLGR